LLKTLETRIRERTIGEDSGSLQAGGFGGSSVQSAESAIGFGRRLQRREIAGLRNRGSCSLPLTSSGIWCRPNRRSRIAQKEPNQFALSLNSGFGKNTLNLRTNGIISYADRIRYLPRRMAITQQLCHPTFSRRQTKPLAQNCRAWPLSAQRIRDKDNYRPTFFASIVNRADVWM
jgi:hypothetical protein